MGLEPAQLPFAGLEAALQVEIHRPDRQQRIGGAPGPRSFASPGRKNLQRRRAGRNEQGCFEADGETSFGIETIPRVGYRLTPTVNASATSMSRDACSP